MDIYTVLFLIVIGFIPSLIWIFYYYRKDCHPEPKILIAKTMLAGILLAPVAAFAQWAFNAIGIKIIPGYDHSLSVGFFLWAAFVEEFVKFLAFKWVVMRNPEFDEPIDAMIYMISAALGFAAIENVLFLSNTLPLGDATIKLLVLRFVGATLLHAVSAATTGYFIALAWFFHQHSKKLIVIGLGIATFMHFSFNILLVFPNKYGNGFADSTLALFVMAVWVTILFYRFQRKMIC